MRRQFAKIYSGSLSSANFQRHSFGMVAQTVEKSVNGMKIKPEATKMQKENGNTKATKVNQ